MIDAYDVSLRATQRTLEAAQHEAAISKQECEKLENKIIEIEKKMAVFHNNYKQQAGLLDLEILKHKGIFMKLYNYYCMYILIRTCKARKIVWHLIRQYCTTNIYIIIIRLHILL